jgi:transketolase
MKVTDKLCVNSLKMLSIDMIDNAKSGHPGIALGAANVLYTLYAKCLMINPHDPKWFNRDRFVMSAGHGSALLYATLYMSGYDLNISDLKNFRKINSLTPGHPEHGVTPGVEASTGPLGQGVANAVGMALAERYYESMCKKYNQGESIIDYYTYVLCGDGDLMEGVSYEALSFAGTQNLDKLIVLYDANNISLDGPIKSTFTENVVDRMMDFGFDIQMIESDVDTIEKAIKKAKKSKKPSFIYISSIIGEGSKYQDTNIVHGKPLDNEDILSLRSSFELNTDPFVLSAEVLEYWHKKIMDRCIEVYDNWNKDKIALSNANKNIKMLFNNIESSALNIDFDLSNFSVSDDYEEDLRDTNQKIMNIIARKSPYFLGGSADVASSTKTIIFNEEVMSQEKPLDRNIAFGVREHAMGAILNGMALSNLHVFGSTFFTFSDYLKPAIRMSALQSLPVNYVFTHDSVLIGPDGPTHEPVEQLITLRSIPNLNVLRPADINEVLGSWDVALKSKCPNAIVIARSNLPKLKGTNPELVKHGAYMVKKERKHLDAILVASGSELSQVLRISDELDFIGINTRVVSMVSQELFDKESRDYKKQLLPSDTLIIAVELSTPNNYYKYTHPKYVIGVETFGYSGSSKDVSEKMLVDYDTLKSRIEKMIRNF